VKSNSWNVAEGACQFISDPEGATDPFCGDPCYVGQKPERPIKLSAPRPLRNISCFGLLYSRDGYSIPNFEGRKRLKSFFRSRAVVQRHLSSPLLQERLEYLQHCANQGYGLKTSEALVR
jgi:hypothetical protein